MAAKVPSARRKGAGSKLVCIFIACLLAPITNTLRVNTQLRLFADLEQQAIDENNLKKKLENNTLFNELSGFKTSGGVIG